MKAITIALFALLFATSCMSTDFSAGSPGYQRVDFAGGSRNYSDNNLDDGDVDRQDAVSLAYSVKREGDLLGAEFGVGYGWKDNTGNGDLDVDTDAIEVYTGLVHRGKFGGSPVGYFVSAGATYIGYKLDPEQGRSDDDESFGAYVGAGVEYAATEELALTLGYRRVVWTDAELYDVDTDFDSGQFSVGVGWSF